MYRITEAAFYVLLLIVVLLAATQAIIFLADILTPLFEDAVYNISSLVMKVTN